MKDEKNNDNSISTDAPEAIPSKKIVVTKSAYPRIHLPEPLPPDFCITDDILREITNALRDEKNSSLCLLLFITQKEIDTIENFLKNFRTEDLMYAFVVVTENDTAGFTDAEHPCVATMRNTQITLGEFYFIVSKNMDLLLKEFQQNKQNSLQMIQLIDTYNDQESLINIGRSLSLEKDPDKLLRSILFMSKKITGADAGSIYLIEEDKNQNNRLRFKYSHTFSRPLQLEEFTLPLNTSSIAGYVAVTGTVLNIPDVYELSPDAPVQFNRSYDQKNKYRTKSMLVVPMRNHQDTIIGVIQLINSKESARTRENYSGNEAYEILLENPIDYEQIVVPFKKRYEALMEAVSGQAAIAIENNRMLKQIENQFEEFVKASVSAIESRDPATSGHSFRVADISLHIAEAINSTNTGMYAKEQFTESRIKQLEFAALLHDFGKVYIDPSIFTKSKKLFPRDYKFLNLRLEMIYKSIELDYAGKIASLPAELSLSEDEYSKEKEKLEKERDKKLRCIQDIINQTAELNEPTIVDKDRDTVIQEISEYENTVYCEDLEGNKLPLLTDEEIKNLAVRRGTLNKRERALMEKHVEYTYQFVRKIPWPEEYKKIPEIAYKHHEKLDGSGYPNKLKGREAIPLEARIMTIADIYDALSARDRPYKKSVPIKRILEILSEESADFKLDPEIVDIFLTRKIYKKV